MEVNVEVTLRSLRILSWFLTVDREFASPSFRSRTGFRKLGYLSAFGTCLRRGRDRQAGDCISF
jgi:hypothetical protein